METNKTIDKNRNGKIIFGIGSFVMGLIGGFVIRIITSKPKHDWHYRRYGW
jgi:hypothetical protein